MNTLKIFQFLVLATATSQSYAADTLSRKYPKAVLVQIRSENNRIAALIKAKDKAGLAQVIYDALEARKAMIYDFSHNFRYCPVYYYIDTNAELVKQKKFDNILLDSNGNTVTDPIINSNSKDYVVLYYGYRLVQSNATKVVKDVNNPEDAPGKGLVILNDEFLQISYLYKLGYADLLLKGKKKRKDHYSSKKYDIDYYPSAKALDERLRTKGPKNKINKGQL